MVNLEWYRSFIATYQTGTVTAAASKRFLTQPALSQHIAALEQALKIALFERSARRMVPTEAAKKLYPQVAASIERLEAIEHASLADSDTPWLRVGAPITYFYEQVLPRIRHDNLAQLRLQLILGETSALIEKLRNNELDLVLSTQKLSQPRLHYVFLGFETFKLILPKSLDMRVTDLQDLDQIETWLSQQHWISYSADMPIIRRFWQTVFKKRPDFEPRLIIPDLHTILRSIELGMGISILPDYLLTDIHISRNIHIPWQTHTEVKNALYLACQQDRLRKPAINSAIARFLPK